MKSFLIVLIALFLAACGVSTNSSKSSQAIASGTETGISTGTGGTGSDTNGTGTDTGTTVAVVDETTDAGFSKVDAIKDPNACIANNTFKFIEDSSFDPNSVADSANGLELASQYPYSANLEATKVVLYYPSIGVSLLGKTVNLYEENYRLSFDKAWSSSSNSSVYVRTPKDSTNTHSCYRYELSSLSGAGITRTKVYR